MLNKGQNRKYEQIVRGYKGLPLLFKKSQTELTELKITTD